MDEHGLGKFFSSLILKHGEDLPYTWESNGSYIVQHAYILTKYEKRCQPIGNVKYM